jgi:hypothetical protein
MTSPRSRPASRWRRIAPRHFELRARDPEPDPFRFASVRGRLDGVRKAAALLSTESEALAQTIARRIAQYTPENTRVATRLYAVLGGSSDGWAPGDGAFYLAVQYFGDDVPGLTAMATHEIYHVAQPSFFSDAKDESLNKTAARVLQLTVLEGTATLVGNPDLFPGDGNYLKFLRDKQSRNRSRMNDNFKLFEALYFRAVNDPAVKIDDLYDLGFSGTWDSPLYFVGAYIAESVEQHAGSETLLQLLRQQPPRALFAKYIEIYSGDDNSGLLHFSPAIETSLSK